MNRSAANPASPPGQPIAALYDAVKDYGQIRAVNGVDLKIHPGEVLALLGPNGAGKSSAIAMLLGLTAPDQGRAELFGQSPHAYEARCRIGVMLQSAALPDQLRVGELIRQGASYYPRPRAWTETIALAGVEDILDRRYGKLSGGQQRRVQFAIALCGDPEMLFLDEPTTGLDLEARERLWKSIRAQVSKGCGVLLTTHYLEEAEALADRVAVIAGGAILAQGSLDEIRARVGHKRVRGLSGISLQTAESWNGVQQASRDGDWLNIIATDAEAVLRQWLAADPDLRDLELRRAGLAEAFVEITRATGRSAGASA